MNVFAYNYKWEFSGGEDFDEAIVAAYIKDFEDKTGLAFPDDKILRRKLQNECCEAKQAVVGMKGSIPIEVMSTN